MRRRTQQQVNGWLLFLGLLALSWIGVSVLPKPPGFALGSGLGLPLEERAPRGWNDRTAPDNVAAARIVFPSEENTETSPARPWR